VELLLPEPSTSLSNNFPVITPTGIEAFADSCPHLESFSVANCGVKSKSIVYLLTRCPKLHTFDLSNCKWIKDSDIEALSSNCPQLRVLNLSKCVGIADPSLHSLSQYCSRLQSLNISGVSVSDSGIQANSWSL